MKNFKEYKKMKEDGGPTVGVAQGAVQEPVVNKKKQKEYTDKNKKDSEEEE